MAGGWAEDASLRLTRIVCPVSGQRIVEGTGSGNETAPVPPQTAGGFEPVLRQQLPAFAGHELH